MSSDDRTANSGTWDVPGLLRAVHMMLKMSNDETTPTDTSRHEKDDKDVEEEAELTVEMFRTCMDPGRKKSLRSLEIPLDNLLSGVIYTAGGRDLRGGPVLILTQPSHLELEVLMELTNQDFFDMLAYFTSVPSTECRGRGFTVVIDGEVIHDFLLRIMIRGLAIMHTEEHMCYRVFFVSSVRDISQIDWRLEYCGNLDVQELPFQQVKTYAKLQQYIDPAQLTAEFGGTLSYSHQDWVRFRMQVEPFLCDCISVSKYLARAIEPFTEDSVPDSVEEVEESIQQHHLMRRKTLDSLHIDQLTSEGSHIDQHMHCAHSQHVTCNPDFQHTMTTISTLLGQIGSVKGRLETLWDGRHDKLQTNLRQKKFEKEAGKVIEWFEECAGEFFETHTELGESREVAESLIQEVLHFEESTKDILSTTGDLLTSGVELEQSPYIQEEVLGPLMGKIQCHLAQFNLRLADRKTKLTTAVQTHRLIEQALDWCIDVASFLSNTDMLGSAHQAGSGGLDAHQLKTQLEQFLLGCHTPSKEVLSQLQRLSEDEEWTREGAAFASHRIQEVNEKIAHIRSVLDQRIAEEAKEEPASEKNGPVEEESEGVAKLGRVKLKLDPEEEGKGVANNGHDQMANINTWDSEEDLLRERKGEGSGGVTLRHPRTLDHSLHYDDVGAGHAMMLLKNIAEQADARLKPTADEADGDHTHTRISKQDISQPTHASGPLFSTGSAPDSDEEDNLSAAPTLSEQRRKIEELPCPLIDNSLHAQTKNARHRRKLMEELIQTEGTFIKDMEWVVENYMPAMDDISAVPRNLVGKKNFIFSTLPQLLQLNKLVIFPQLQSLSKCPVKLGLVFMTLEEDLLNYSLYFKNLPQQTALMEEGGIQFFAEVSERISDRFFLNSYLIKPFQRITKYKIFLKEMMKYTSKTDLKGKLKEYYDKLKEAHKMVDFILRHGNDLLGVDCIRGLEGNLVEHGKVLRQGDLLLVDLTKHHRRVFLFENSIILTKKRKSKHQQHEVAASEIFDFKQTYKTSAFALRENVEGHPTRFQLYRKKETLTFQADTMEDKTTWVQDIWDLFFSHMLSLKDQNLEAHGTTPLTSLAAAGSATIGRSFGHSLRRAMSVRHSRSSMYGRRRAGTTATTSHASPISRRSTSTLSEDVANSPNRNSGTFVDLRPHSFAELDTMSDRSSIISSSSVSTLSSVTTVPPTSNGVQADVLNYSSSPSLIGDHHATPPHHLATAQRQNLQVVSDNHKTTPNRAPSPLLTTRNPANSPQGTGSDSSPETTPLESSGSSPAFLSTPL